MIDWLLKRLSPTYLTQLTTKLQLKLWYANDSLTLPPETQEGTFQNLKKHQLLLSKGSTYQKAVLKGSIKEVLKRNTYQKEV